MTNKGGLPRGWRMAQLPEIVDVDPRISPPAGWEDETLVDFVPMALVDENTATIQATEQKPFSQCRSGKSRFSNGDILFAKITPCVENGKIALVSGLEVPVAFGSTEFFVLRPQGALLPEFLWFYVRQPRIRQSAAALFTGSSGRQRVPSSFWKTVEVPLPPTEVQASIVQILQQADGIRRKRVEARRIADRLLPTIFLEMFGDPGTNPMGWPKKLLEAVSEVRQGVAKGRNLRGKEAVKAPYLRVANVQEGYLDLSEVKDIDVLPSDLERYRLERGDVLLTEGGDPDKLGRGFIWSDEIQGCIYQNHIFRVRVDRRVLLPEFLAFLTRTPYAKRYFLKAAKRSSNLASINASQLRAFSVPLPPIGIQERFRDAFNAASQRLLAPEATATTEALFARLLAAAFAGELVA